MLNQTEPNRKRVWPVEITPLVASQQRATMMLEFINKLADAKQLFSAERVHGIMTVKTFR